MQRIFDLVLGLLVTPLVLSLIAVLALIIRFKDRNPVFFYQKRLGKDEREFTCIKLTTLRPTTNEADILDRQRNLERFTAFGLWLRNRGLDELPQLVNVLAGHMSFIGPRPLYHRSFEFIEQRNPEMTVQVRQWRAERSRVRPGLSGWHQIHSPEGGIIKYDLEYLKNPNLPKRLKVFLVSAWIMLVGKEKYFARKNP